MKRTALILALLVLSAVPLASAQQNLYLALNAGKTFCDTITFGDFGKGEYTLDISDPGYPDNPWVDIHRVSFISEPDNPVTVPVCFSTKNRKNGDEGVVHFNLEAPERNVSFDYGVCVSEFEDADIIVSTSDPCAATEQHTDIFNMDILQQDLYAQTGESVPLDLILSSDMDISISLEKDIGPSMDISRTTVEMPGDEMVHIDIKAPPEPGTYPFVITGKVAGCDSPSCIKSVEGSLHVDEERSGFDIHFSPRNRNIAGIHSATYYLTIENFEKTGVFSLALEKDDALDSDTSSMEVTIAGNTRRTLGIVVVPKEAKKRLFTLMVSVRDGQGRTKTATAMLTVNEAVSDVRRAAENGTLSDKDASGFEEHYNSGSDLSDWKDINGKIGNEEIGGDNDEGQGLPSWIIWLAAAGLITGIGAFYIYKKSKVTKDIDSDEYRPY